MSYPIGLLYLFFFLDTACNVKKQKKFSVDAPVRFGFGVIPSATILVHQQKTDRLEAFIFLRIAATIIFKFQSASGLFAIGSVRKQTGF
jgi:hypothetical protein